MRHNVVRITLITVIVGLVVFGPAMKSYSEDENKGKWIDVLSYHWGVPQTEFVRVCLANPRNVQGNDVLLTSVISFEVRASEAIERELRIPVGEVRCTDVTPEQLVAAGAEPEPTGRVNFLLTVSAFTDVNSRTISAGQNLPIGSIEAIEPATGQTRIYGGIHWAFDNQR